MLITVHGTADTMFSVYKTFTDAQFLKRGQNLGLANPRLVLVRGLVNWRVSFGVFETLVNPKFANPGVTWQTL